jgi:hypothetical protein
MESEDPDLLHNKVRWLYFIRINLTSLLECVPYNKQVPKKIIKEGDLAPNSSKIIVMFILASLANKFADHFSKHLHMYNI